MEYARSYNPTFGQLGAHVAQLWPEKDIIKAKGKSVDTIGLALSGGGYRSAIFNYGVLRGLYEIGLLGKIDYLSVVSGGSWIGTPFSMSAQLDFFFRLIDDHPNFMEEGFESLLPNPRRVIQEMALSRKNANYLSNVFGRLLAKTFLREHGDSSRWKPLSDETLIRDDDRPFLIVNGTAYFRRPGTFDVTQECFEMTRLYCGSRALGYLPTADLKAKERLIRIRDAIAVSGAAVSLHLPGLGEEVAGLGLSREIPNYSKGQANRPANAPDADEIDLADGGFYNNLGVESLINRGCGYLIVVDAEHDPESKTATHSNQKYSGLKTLLKRHHIKVPSVSLKKLDKADQAVHLFEGNDSIPDILYVKLKSSKQFNRSARKKPYNEPGFLRNLFGHGGPFAFDPQYSTAKLDYDFVEHRNLSELGAFLVTSHRKIFRNFVGRAN